MGKKLKISRTNVAILSFEIEDLKKNKFIGLTGRASLMQDKINLVPTFNH